MPRRRPLPEIAASLALLLAPAAAPAAPDAGAIAGVARVVDGRTLEVGGRTVALHGVDAPDPGQTCASARHGEFDCGRVAALTLRDLLGRSVVSCDPVGTDPDGRVEARCSATVVSLDGAPDRTVDVNAEMVLSGWAFARWLNRDGHRSPLPCAPDTEGPCRVSVGDYLRQEAAAVRAGLGLWACDFEFPWDRRRRGRS